MTAEFRLRFPLDEIGRWADKYGYAADDVVEAIGSVAGQRGWYAREELLAIARWKTRGRSVHWCQMNTAAAVRRATSRALATEDERERVKALLQLRGVQLPTASVLLHLARPTLFPIIDFRAIWSLGVDERMASYGFEFWWAYTLACRALAAKAGVSMRRLDRALWQYSKERQPRGSGCQVDRAGSMPRLRVQRGQKEREGPAADVTVDPLDSQGHRIGRKPMPLNRKYPYRADIHARLIETAARGSTITYSGLLTNRRMVGSYLYRIAKEEQAAGRPPLTALVVHKVDGKPGPGFLEAAKWVDFWRNGETEDEVWQRAVAEVHEYWRPKLTDDLDGRATPPMAAAR